ncbi:unnamed protein product [Caenorhabditis bovis]|uniref:SAP domain-containing protein n=1 Tax=Caenorhabditis bovis TaxID=2654633 RepID=A0A8S1EZD2_9PELO|nr:unnamed protein product [Caenorhabditis bovis]
MVLTAADAKKLTVPRLKDELSKRGLETSGNKADLLARLIESIEADEDSILNDTVPGDLPLPSDILNEDILDAPSINGDDDKLLNTSTEEASEVEIKKDETSQNDQQKKPASHEETKLARAARFGLPVGVTATAETLASTAAKEARAKRFGVTANAEVLSSEEKKAKRAERFGITGTDVSTKDKLAARAARFGIPVNADGKKTIDTSDEKLKSRAVRFGLIDADAEAKKKARLERFGAST